MVIPAKTLKEVMEAAQQSVRGSPSWLKAIHVRNEVLDQHRRDRSKDRYPLGSQ